MTGLCRGHTGPEPQEPNPPDVAEKPTPPPTPENVEWKFKGETVKPGQVPDSYVFDDKPTKWSWAKEFASIFKGELEIRFNKPQDVFAPLSYFVNLIGYWAALGKYYAIDSPVIRTYLKRQEQWVKAHREWEQRQYNYQQWLWKEELYRRLQMGHPNSGPIS